MTFFRRKKREPISSVYVPLLKLFRATQLGYDKSPILLSGPKSRRSLGIGLHTIIIPQHPEIDTRRVWKYARWELWKALTKEGLPKEEAEVFCWRMIDPLNPPIEVDVQVAEEDLRVLEDFRRLVTYQLLQGIDYDGTMESLIRIYGELSVFFQAIAQGETPHVDMGNPGAELVEELGEIRVRNITLTMLQDDIAKTSMLNLTGKIREIAKFYNLFTQPKYLSKTTPQQPQHVKRIYCKSSPNS